MIVVSGVVDVKPESRDLALEEIAKVVHATKSESGCIAYDFYVHCANPNLFHVFEEWESEEALNAHLQQAHTIAFLQKTSEFFASLPQIRKYEVSSAKSLF